MGSTEHGYVISCSKLFADPVIREVVGGLGPSPTYSRFLYLRIWTQSKPECMLLIRGSFSFEGARERICVVGSKVVPDSDRSGDVSIAQSCYWVIKPSVLGDDEKIGVCCCCWKKRPSGGWMKKRPSLLLDCDWYRCFV